LGRRANGLREISVVLKALLQCFAVATGLLLAASLAVAQAPDTIARVKSSVVAVGTVQKLRSPQFQFLGTGFAVGDGSLIATNAHVVAKPLADGKDPELLAIAIPSNSPQRAQIRVVQRAGTDAERDLALLRTNGPPLPALSLRDSDSVREGEQLLLTGFPIGTVLGLFAATHRAMVAAITPIAIPMGDTRKLDTAMVRRLQSGAFPVFQLDATSYPGNSGSPLYDPATGEVVGVLNMVFVKGTKEKALTDPSGISYAIPSRYLQLLISASR
jgi:S1-C subfamily serine protease